MLVSDKRIYKDSSTYFYGYVLLGLVRYDSSIYNRHTVSRYDVTRGFKGWSDTRLHPYTVGDLTPSYKQTVIMHHSDQGYIFH